MAALKAQKSDSTSASSSTAPEVIKGSYTPIGKVDIAALRAQAKEQEQNSRSSAPPQRSPQPDRDTSSSYVGTSGYKPVQLPPPKPLGGSSRTFGPSVSRSGGTVAPMPTGPLRESKAIGGASKNFAADASGKTPSQLWAERKARERGEGPGQGVVPDIAPQRPLPRGTEPPVSPGTYVEDSSSVIGTMGAGGGVRAMRDRFARQSLGEDDSPGALPISPAGMRPAKNVSPRMPPSPPSPPAAPSPPPVASSSKPPPRTYQSLDHVVSAGAGAGVGLGVGVLASQAMHHEEPEEEPEPEPLARTPSPPPAPPVHETSWDTTAEQDHQSEDEEEHAARHGSQMHAEQTYEPEPEEYHVQHEEHEEEPEVSRQESGAQSSKSAVVLFEYEAQEANELNLIEGQLITNIEFVDDVLSPFSQCPYLTSVPFPVPFY